jgi:hypothetical protein
MGRSEPARIIFGAVAAARSLLAYINDRENELAKLAIKPQDLEVIHSTRKVSKRAILRGGYHCDRALSRGHSA